MRWDTRAQLASQTWGRFVWLAVCWPPCQEQQGSGRCIFGLPQLKIWYRVGKDRLCKLSLCCSAQHWVPSTAVLLL